jgi:hypothetical protein
MGQPMQIMAHVYTKVVRFAVDDTGVSRKLTVLGADLKPKEVCLPGPRALVVLKGSRDFRVDSLGQIQVRRHGNAQIRDVKEVWLNLHPVFGKVARGGVETDEVKGIMDDRGTSIPFDMIDSNLEG